ncbi:hypothetical protein JNW88_11990 [Micromonospora sp. ATA32]|nr:hypothetical protein [Micromonospora sp. ATA32]
MEPGEPAVLLLAVRRRRHGELLRSRPAGVGFRRPQVVERINDSTARPA